LYRNWSQRCRLLGTVCWCH